MINPGPDPGLPLNLARQRLGLSLLVGAAPGHDLVEYAPGALLVADLYIGPGKVKLGRDLIFQALLLRLLGARDQDGGLKLVIVHGQLRRPGAGSAGRGSRVFNAESFRAALCIGGGIGGMGRRVIQFRQIKIRVSAAVRGGRRRFQIEFRQIQCHIRRRFLVRRIGFKLKFREV